MSMEERFWKRVEKTDGCWLWTGSKAGGRDGRYGTIRETGPSRKSAYTHRYSYELHHGPIPDGHVVMHTCDVPACVNPDHLLLGTQGDNVKDMDAKGRRVNTQKITDADRSEIIRRALAGEKQRSIADDFGVSRDWVARLKMLHLRKVRYSDRPL